ncbi:hypothetical protein [Rubellimicrobium aerolatum]|nr:hypothetical protein [Rubellimicrobium aerolatum]MBP1806458.1 hypothetical protein [Rubellimicrobium aerolatum]
MTFELPDAVELLTLGSGEVLTAEHGSRLWRGSVTLATRRHAVLEDIMARLRVLQRPGASFLVSPRHHERVGAGAATLNTIRNGRELRLSGLAAGVSVPRGAYLSFTYGSSPTRYALHQLAEAMVADSAGLTGWGEVVPPLKAGTTTGTAVQLAAPVLKAVLVPKSVRAGQLRSVLGEGATFDWIQTLR